MTTATGDGHPWPGHHTRPHPVISDDKEARCLSLKGQTEIG